MFLSPSVEAAYIGAPPDEFREPVRELMHEEDSLVALRPHAALLSAEGYVPAFGSCYVPGPNPAKLDERNLLRRMYVLDAWLDHFNREGGVLNDHRRAVWTELNAVVGGAHDVIRSDRQQVFGAQYALQSVAEWYRFEGHFDHSLRSVGETLHAANAAMRDVIAPKREHRLHCSDCRPEQRQLPQWATAFI